MKKTWILSAIVASASGAVAWPQTTGIQQQIIAHERQELEAVKAGKVDEFASLIAEDAVFVDPRGTASKNEVVAHVADTKLLDFSMDDVKFVPLSADSGLIVYKLTQRISARGKEFSSVAHASALWVKRGEKWVCVFSQESPVRSN